MLYKNIKYQDQNNKFHQKDIAIIQLGQADIIGENALIHGDQRCAVPTEDVPREKDNAGRVYLYTY